MDANREFPLQQPSIWQSQTQRKCATNFATASPGPSNWFAKARGRDSCSPTVSRPPKLCPKTSCRVTTAPRCLLRLSSTGDSVAEDTTESSRASVELDLSSVLTIHGSGSTAQRAGQDLSKSRQPPGRSRQTGTGLLDRFTNLTKLAFPLGYNYDYKQHQQKSAMSLARETSPGKPWENQVELDALVAKFAGTKTSVEERSAPHHHHHHHPAQQAAAMNGFVEEGVYHPYQRPAVGQPPSRGSPSPAAAPPPFRFLNVGGPCGVRRYHQHPYASQNHFAPGRSAGAPQFWADWCCPRPCPGGPPARPLPADRSPARNCDRPAPQSKPPSPASKPASAQCRRNCCPARTAPPRLCASGPHLGPVATNRCSSVTRPSASESATTHCRGSSHQLAPTSPTCAKNTPMPRHSKHSGETAIRRPEIGDPPSAEPSTTTAAGPISRPGPNLENIQDVRESCSRISLTTNEEDCDNTVHVSGLHDMDIEQTVRSEPTVASSVCTSSQQTDHTTIAGPETRIPSGPKSEDKQTSCDASDSRSLEVERCTLSSPTPSPAVDPPHNLPEGRTRALDSLEGDGSNAAVSPSPRSPADARSELGSEPEPEPTLDPKPLHSSLAFLLSGLTSDPTSDLSSDSDWDSDSDDSSSSLSRDSWDFLGCWDDPYNPLHGWKCGKRADGQSGAPCVQTEGAAALIEPDASPADDEMDSGISSLQTQPDEREGEDVVADDGADSDPWDEEDADASRGRLDQLWRSFCPTSDPMNPLSGWMCSSVAPARPAPEPRKAARRTPRKRRPKSRDPRPTREADPDPDPDSTVATQSPMESDADSAKMHPSVLFILGIGDAQSNSDPDDSDDDDDSSSDEDWGSSFGSSPVPCSPLQAARLQPVILEDSSSDGTTRVRPETAVVSPDDDDGRAEPESADPMRRRISDLGRGSPSLVKPSLKRASSTGCLWIPSEEEGTGRPFRNKKVHFCTSPTVISFEVPKWSGEYCASRKGPWQEMARDRCRFRDRILTTEPQIAPVLTPEHRRKVRQRLDIADQGFPPK